MEIADDKVTALREYVADENLPNVEVIRNTPDDPKLPDEPMDMIFTCNTYHHVEDRTEYFARLIDRLSPAGKIAHVDHRDDVGGVLRLCQSDGHWTNEALMRREMDAAGYRTVASFEFLPLQSYQLFAPAP